MWRGTALILEKSHLTVSGRILRHPLTQKLVHSANNLKAALRWCRQNGYGVTRPEKDVDFERLESRL